jgi:hypothetical protein
MATIAVKVLLNLGTCFADNNAVSAGKVVAV